MSTVENRLREIVKGHLYPDQDITANSSFIDDLGADSLDAIELHIAVEDEFEIEVDESEWEKVVTFGDAVTLVTRVLG